MSEFVFQGTSALALDGKGRMTVPVRHREALAQLCTNQLTITRHTEQCLLVFPRPAWTALRAQLMALSNRSEHFKRLYLGSAVDVDVDSADRVLIPPELRQWAGLQHDVMLVGMGTRFELWDAARHAQAEAAALAKGPTDEFESISF